MKDNDQIYKILLEHLSAMREDIGEMRSDIKTVKTATESMSTTVKKHDDIISNWQGRIAVIAGIVGIVGTTIISWVKKELNL